MFAKNLFCVSGFSHCVLAAVVGKELVDMVRIIRFEPSATTKKRAAETLE